jgi:hypothetical protein
MKPEYLASILGLALLGCSYVSKVCCVWSDDFTIQAVIGLVQFGPLVWAFCVSSARLAVPGST